MKSYTKKVTRRSDRVFVVGIGRPGLTKEKPKLSLAELVELVKTAGAEVVGSAYQDLKKIDPATFIGKGKVQDIAEQVKQTQADVVILDEEISPIQNRNLEKLLNVYVLDRTAVILDIFAMRARTSEGKLQVELAQLEYLAPRLVGRGQMLSQQTGGIGTRGPGETQLEKDRRRIKDRITHLKRRIDKVRGSREIYRAKRQSVPIPLVAIVGYTNAGKSTLMNQLTKASVFVEDKLFATLDPTVRRLRLPSGREVLLADTVGFIRRLPHQLVAAFKATFEEIGYADLILEVIDAADPDAQRQRQVVDEVLTEMELNQKPHLIVFNKSDLAEKHINAKDAINVSALKAQGLDILINKIDHVLRENFLRIELKLPYAEGDILSTIYRVGHVFEVKHQDDYIYIDCELPHKYVQKYRKYLMSLRTK